MLRRVDDPRHRRAARPQRHRRRRVPRRLDGRRSELIGAAERVQGFQHFDEEAVRDDQRLEVDEGVADLRQAGVGRIVGRGERSLQAVPRRLQGIIHVLAQDAGDLEGRDRARVHQLDQAGQRVHIGHHLPAPAILVDARRHSPVGQGQPADGDDLQGEDGPGRTEAQAPPGADARAKLEVGVSPLPVDIGALL